MAEISANVTLRPTRIGFLVRPTDLTSVRAIMRACTCVWGGVYNPIIPVFKRPPPEWKEEIFRRVKGVEVAKGYVRFFEPDVYVEAEEGLLEEAGLGALREKYAIYHQVITLKEFLQPQQDRTWAEPLFGLHIHDVLKHIYKTEEQFVRRDKLDHVLVAAEKNNALVEAVFGAFPASAQAKYFEKEYVDVYQPTKLKSGAEAWRRVFLRNAETPLRVTRFGLDLERYWHHDLVIFVFDPKRATDLIDLWNMRLEPHPVLPVPIDWFTELSDDLYKILKREHRPVMGNPNGVMHNATIEFGRSIPREKAEATIGLLKPGLPAGALSVKYWRNAVWVEYRDDRVHRDQRMRITASQRSIDLVVREGKEITTSFEPLIPEFASEYGRGRHRWVNAVRISKYGERDMATVLPFNTFDRAWPRLGLGGEQIAVGVDGWVFPQQYKKLNQYVSLLDSNVAISGSLSRMGIESKLSEPGHVARQMLENLGGLRGVYLIADLTTIELLNKMSGGLRRQSNQDDTIEENFGLRTAPLKDWTDLISKRKAKGSLPTVHLEEFTKHNVIRIGLETNCPHCQATNWTTLTAVDYRITCERCLKGYDFPQAHLKKSNQNFTYRVIGPFSVPDYGRGSYGALLALRVLEKFHSGSSAMTFSTAMDLSINGKKHEIDFVAWRNDDRLGDDHRAPTLIIGESKSLGKGDLIKPKDLLSLKAVASRLPDAVVVISVMRSHFTDTEKEILKKFVKWGRKANEHGEPTNPVLLLTANELMMDHFISAAWKDLGGLHAKFSEYDHTRNLLSFADSTQRIYLGMKPFHDERQEYWRKRHARKKAKKGAGAKQI